MVRFRARELIGSDRRQRNLALGGRRDKSPGPWINRLIKLRFAPRLDSEAKPYERTDFAASARGEPPHAPARGLSTSGARPDPGPVSGRTDAGHRPPGGGAARGRRLGAPAPRDLLVGDGRPGRARDRAPHDPPAGRSPAADALSQDPRSAVLAK